MRHAWDLEEPIQKPCAAQRIYSTPKKKNTPRRGSGAFRTDEMRNAEDLEIEGMGEKKTVAAVFLRYEVEPHRGSRLADLNRDPPVTL